MSLMSAMRRLRRGGPRPTVDAALRDLGDADARVRVAAADALGDCEGGDRARAAEALIPALRDLAPEVRSTAALSLGELGLERAVEPLCRCIDDGVTAVRQSAIIALGRLGLQAGFAPLAEALRGGPPDVRFQAATSLVEIDADRALAPLLEALGDRDPEVVGAVALALGVIGDRAATDRLAALLDHPRAETRFDVAYALARLGDPRGSAVLGEFVADKQRGWDAIEGLELGDPATAEPVFARAALDLALPIETRLRAAAALLHAHPDAGAAPAARAALLGALTSRRFLRRALAVELTGRFAGRWALPALDDLAGRWRGRRLTHEIADAIRQIEQRHPKAKD